MVSINQAISETKNLRLMRYNSDFHKSLQILYSGIFDLFGSVFQDKKVIELGPGKNPVAKFVLNEGATEYVGVERFITYSTNKALPFDERISVVNNDGLSYLLNQPRESAIVVSYGLMCPELFENDDYLTFLGKEIYRVTTKNAITMQTTILSDFQRKSYFEQHGFKPTRFEFVWSK